MSATPLHKPANDNRLPFSDRVMLRLQEIREAKQRPRLTTAARDGKLT
jgi:hypothetical protein